MTDLPWLTALKQYDWLVGALVGAGLTFFTQWVRDRSKRREQQRAVTMLLATQLRSWITQSVSMLYDIKNAEQSGGEIGEWHSRLPVFGFERDLGRVTQLSTKDAKEIFSLAHEKAEVQRHFEALADIVGGEEAGGQLVREWAQMVLTCQKTYARLAASVGWEMSFLPGGNVRFLEEAAATSAASVRSRRRSKAAADRSNGGGSDSRETSGRNDGDL